MRSILVLSLLLLSISQAESAPRAASRVLFTCDGSGSGFAATYMQLSELATGGFEFTYWDLTTNSLHSFAQSLGFQDPGLGFPVKTSFVIDLPLTPSPVCTLLPTNPFVALCSSLSYSGQLEFNNASPASIAGGVTFVQIDRIQTTSAGPSLSKDEIEVKVTVNTSTGNLARFSMRFNRSDCR
jgi:hypothetical protein